MPYRYLEDIATADIAFEAWGQTLEETFVAAADATMNVMVEELDSIAPIERRIIDVSAEEIDMLLFETLQELIFYKDADTLLLRVSAVRIRKEDDTFFLSGDAYGEEIDRTRHNLIVDVKAVTLHRLKMQKKKNHWNCTVVLDI